MINLIDKRLAKTEPKEVLDALDTMCEEHDLYNIKRFIERVYCKLEGVTLTEFAAHTQDKKLPLVYNLLLEELSKLLGRSDNISLDRFIACSDSGAVIKCRRLWTDIVYTSPEHESLKMMQSAGLRNTLLYYYLIYKHCDKQHV